MNFLKFFCFLISHQFFFTSFGKKRIINHECAPSSCGSIRNIANPFRLKHDPQHCGHPNYELSCEDNTTLIYFNSHKYAVKSINYDNYTIRVADVSITGDVCSLPTASLAQNDFDQNYYYSIENRNYSMPGYSRYELTMPVSFISCLHKAINISDFVPVASFCGGTNGSAGDVEGKNRYSTIKIGHFNGLDLMDTCRIDVMVMTSAPSLLPYDGKVDVTITRIHGYLLYGFELSWIPFLCGNECYDCSLYSNKAECAVYGYNWIMLFVRTIQFLLQLLATPIRSEVQWVSFRYGLPLDEWLFPLSVHVLPKSTAGNLLSLLVDTLEVNLAMKILLWPFVMAFLIYKIQKRRHLSMFHEIEMFLQGNSNLIPIRYSHSNIKKMTRGFRQKLGEGGFGYVYKGTLRSDHDVAVKILKKPKANHQDFINEIATIGRIHHVNVIKLVGYCFEGSTCALVYDFMSNGSLNEYAFGEERASLLSLEKKCEIVVGVAQGIEYLHRGCNIQILHFDIKPHNILLDQNFTPKLSDFGLAKFYSTKRSMVTLTATRGTIGYVAPELINRSFGRVSSKADVYSFGMLLLEMVGLKRDILVGDDESSKYFPDWIYDCFERDTDIEAGIVGESDEDNKHEKTIKRKMTIVGLWCIQLSPQDRPSMNEVLKLLEDKVEDIRIPPHPSKSPLFVRYSDNACGMDSIGSMTTTEDYSDEV